MKAVWLNAEAKTCYITGTNEELKKMLSACNYHTKLAPKESIFGDGALCYNYTIEDDDKLHVVCIEKQYNAKWDSYHSFVYELFPFAPDSIYFPIELNEGIELDGISTPDDVYYTILNCLDEEVVRKDNFSTDTIKDFLEWYYNGRVVDEKEYAEYDNLSEEEKDVLMFDLNQVSFYNEDSPIAHVLSEIGERIPVRFEELIAQSNSEALLELVKNFPQAKGYLNQKSDAEKLDIIKRNHKIIHEIDYPSLEMVKVASKAKEDFQHRNLIGVKTMIEEIEEDYELYKEARDIRNMQWEDFKRDCTQKGYYYTNEKGLPQDLAEDIILNPEESIERLHDGSYAEYWAEMALTGHYVEQDKKEEDPNEKPKYLVMHKVCGECGVFKTLEEATARIKECEESDKLHEIYEKDCYQIVNPVNLKKIQY